MSTLASILSSTFRPLRRRPAFSAAVVVTLALGIAPNCVVFAIMDAVYFRPLPYPRQDRLVLLNLAQKESSALLGADVFTFEAWQSRSRAFEALAAYRSTGFDVRAGEQAQRIPGQSVGCRFFDVLGVSAARGRTLTAADCGTGAQPALVLSHQAWQGEFGGRADIVGLPLRLDGVPATVVGVMPEGFTSFMEGRPARAWTAQIEAPRMAPGGAEANVIARLRPEASIGTAQDDVSAIEASIAAAFPAEVGTRRAVVRDFRSALFGGLGPGIRLLTVIVALLLLIACANAANLLLGRADAEAREIALKTALGASRARLAAAQLGESLGLAFCAAAGGLLLAAWATKFVWASAAPIFVRIGVNAFSFDGRVVVFALALTFATVVLFGVVPALRGSRVDLAEVLKSSGGRNGPAAGRLVRGLVVAQVALCVVTLVVATLVTRSFVHFSGLAASPGFDPSRSVLAVLPQRSGPPASAEARLAMLSELEVRLRAVPGVEAVAMTTAVPFIESGGPVAVSRDGATAGKPEMKAEARAVNAAYFQLTGTTVLKGRALGTEDTRDSRPVAVVDERLARDTWGSADPVGGRLVVGGVPRTVVGVVRVRTPETPFATPSREIYLPHTQFDAPQVNLLVTSRLSSDAAVAAVRQVLRSVDPDQPATRVLPLGVALDDFMIPFRLILSLISAFGTTALLLAAVGLYSVMARGVTRRRREFGVRAALGASPRHIVVMIVGEGMRSASLGLVIGLLIGFGIAAILPAGILGVTSLSPWHFAGAAAVWLAAAALACAVPARRASGAPPAATLHAD